jgi:hypothetical protein
MTDPTKTDYDYDYDYEPSPNTSTLLSLALPCASDSSQRLLREFSERRAVKYSQ